MRNFIISFALVSAALIEPLHAAQIDLLVANNQLDVVFSPDGSRLYASNSDGSVSVFDTATKSEIHRWAIGNNLGGMDITPDGRTLVVVERKAISNYYDPEFMWWNNRTQATVYTVNSETGVVKSNPFTAEGLDGPGVDIAVGQGNVAYVSNTFYGSGWQWLRKLNLADGGYGFVGGEIVAQDGSLTRSADYSRIMNAENNISDARMKVYDPATDTIVGRQEWYNNGIDGYNGRIQAISTSANKAAQLLGSTINIYDANLNFIKDLAPALIAAGYSIYNIQGMSFSANGDWLYVFDDLSDSLLRFTSSDLSFSAAYLVGDLNLDFGFNALTVSNDDRFVAIRGSTSARLISFASDSVPEPAPLSLLVLGVLSLAASSRRQNKSWAIELTH